MKNAFPMRKVSPWIFPMVFLALFCTGTVFSLRRLEEMRSPGLLRDPLYLPDPRYLRILSFGYENLLANILWMKTINYFGAHFRSDRQYPWLYHMCHLVTELDPRAFHVYRFGGVILPWDARETDQALTLLEKGVKNLPHSWYLRYLLGFNYFFFKGDYQKALSHLRVGASLPDCHPIVRNLAVRLQIRQGGPDLALSFLEDLYRRTEEKNLRLTIREKIKEVMMERDLLILGQATDMYREKTGRDPQRLEDLVREKVIQRIPPEPFGGTYFFDAKTKEVKSSKVHKSHLP